MGAVSYTHLDVYKRQGHIKIGDKVGIGAQAGVPGNVKSNEQILGTPAIDAKNFMKSRCV